MHDTFSFLIGLLIHPRAESFFLFVLCRDVENELSVDLRPRDEELFFLSGSLLRIHGERVRFDHALA